MSVQESTTALRPAAATTPDSQSASGPQHRRLLRFVSGAQGPLIGLVLLCVVFALSSNVFLSLRNALNVVDQVTTLAYARAVSASRGRPS